MNSIATGKPLSPVMRAAMRMLAGDGGSASQRDLNMSDSTMKALARRGLIAVGTSRPGTFAEKVVVQLTEAGMKVLDRPMEQAARLDIVAVANVNGYVDYTHYFGRACQRHGGYQGHTECPGCVGDQDGPAFEVLARHAALKVLARRGGAVAQDALNVSDSVFNTLVRQGLVVWALRYSRRGRVIVQITEAGMQAIDGANDSAMLWSVLVAHANARGYFDYRYHYGPVCARHGGYQGRTVSIHKRTTCPACVAANTPAPARSETPAVSVKVLPTPVRPFRVVVQELVRDAYRGDGAPVGEDELRDRYAAVEAYLMVNSDPETLWAVMARLNGQQ